MSMMMTELYDALTNAGADETRARDAATAVAAWGDRFQSGRKSQPAAMDGRL